MNRNEVRDALYPNCPIRNVLSRVGDKWSMLVLFTLENNDCQRFKELQRNIPDISQKMLTATLKMLEGDGLIHREVFPEIPPALNIRLRRKGKVYCRLSTTSFHGRVRTWKILLSRENSIF